MKRLVIGILLAATCTGCVRRVRPQHVPRVHYHATFYDKDCRRHPDGVRWICNNVVLDPDEIQAHPN